MRDKMGLTVTPGGVLLSGRVPTLLRVLWLLRLLRVVVMMAISL
jgi:hypothetical protein